MKRPTKLPMAVRKSQPEKLPMAVRKPQPVQPVKFKDLTMKQRSFVLLFMAGVGFFGFVTIGSFLLLIYAALGADLLF